MFYTFFNANFDVMAPHASRLTPHASRLTPQNNSLYLFENLPRDILKEILQMLDARSVFNFMGTNKLLHEEIKTQLDNGTKLTYWIKPKDSYQECKETYKHLKKIFTDRRNLINRINEIKPIQSLIIEKENSAFLLPCFL